MSAMLLHPDQQTDHVHSCLADPRLLCLLNTHPAHCPQHPSLLQNPLCMPCYTYRQYHKRHRTAEDMAAQLARKQQVAGWEGGHMLRVCMSWFCCNAEDGVQSQSDEAANKAQQSQACSGCLCKSKFMASLSTSRLLRRSASAPTVQWRPPQSGAGVCS
jgi:hypothetical protein